VLPCSWFENSEKKEKKVSFQKQRVIVKVTIENELGFEKNGPRKTANFLYIFFIDVNSINSVEFTQVYRVLTRSNSSNLPILPETEFTSELIRFWYLNT